MQKKKMKLYHSVLFVLFLFCSMTMNAQQKTISGKVTETATGEPIIGASVAVKGTSLGAVTDLDGNFTLNVPENAATLVVSYLGFTTQELPIDKTQFDIVLRENVASLDEVVVIGYGAVRKRDLTGAVSSVTAKDIAGVPVASVSEALTGKMAGVQITTTEGSPDAEIKIRVRGGGSITQSSEPLYIVDGFPVNSINDIAPSDIASIDVLKDASSAAIYGARGANGVVIVSTKRGQEGRVTVNYNAYLGYKKLAKRLNVLEPYDYALWTYEHALLANDGEPYDQYGKFFGNWQDINMYRNVPANDWLDIVFGRTGTTVNHNLSVSGGTDKTRYMFSYNRMDDKAILVGSDFTRNNLSLQLTNNPHERVQLDFQARWSQVDVNGSNVNDGGNEKGSSSTEARMRDVMIYPSIPLTAAELTDPVETDQDFALYNPLVRISDNDRMNQRRTLNMNGSAAWEFINGFTLKTEIGLEQYTDRLDRFYGVTTYFARVNVPGDENKMKPALVNTNRDRQTIRNTNTLQVNLKKYLPQDHNITGVIGQEYLITTNNTMEATWGGFDLSFDLDQARRLANTGNAAQLSRNFSPDDKLLSFFGRVNYDYQSKYLASATFRADGSSKFARGNRWGYFPSVSAAWRISSEEFMKGMELWLSDLKLRASYGTAGNNDIPAGQMTQVFTASSTSWVGGYGSYWAPSKQMANPDLTWETIITRNVGLDWTLLGGRLGGTFEVYQNNTKDLLLNYPTPGTGYDNQYRNMGETQNKGLELSANYIIVDKKNFGATFGANIGFNKNKVISLGDMDVVKGATMWASTEINNDYLVAVGQPIGQMLGYRVAGRYEVNDFNYDPATGRYTLKPDVVDCSGVVGTLRPGSLKLVAKDGGLVVGDGDEFREVIGNANPTHTGGFFLNLRAYGFDLSANFNWSYGNDIYNANKIEYTSTSKFNSRNMIDIMADGNRWTNLNQTTGQLITDPDALAAANATTTMWSPYMRKFVLTDWAVEDGSFLRLNTLTLGYTLPSMLTKKVLLQNCRFYVTGYNVFCWTNYSGFDPEVDTRRAVPYTPGVDWSAFPRSRQLVFGVNLTF